MKSNKSNKSNKVNKQIEDADTEDNEDNNKKKKKKNTTNIVEDSIYDGILLLIIYLLMSQEFVKFFIGKYIKYVNVNSEGVVPFSGVFIYGFIFVLVFLTIRFVVHKISNQF